MLSGGNSSRRSLFSSGHKNQTHNPIVDKISLLFPTKFIIFCTIYLVMSEVKRFFKIYGIVFLLYTVFYAIARFCTVVMFGSEWKVGILEWSFLGMSMVIFLHFFVTIAIPKSIIFIGSLVLGKSN